MSKQGPKTEKPTPVVEPKMNDFEQGALFALELLKTHINVRIEAMRHLELDHDIGEVLNGVRNVLTGLRIKFETDLVKQLVATAAKESKS